MMLLPCLLLVVFTCSIITTESRGPHHPRGDPVSRRNHAHYKPNPEDNEKLTHDDALLHDKQHIEEHLEDMVESPDLSKIYHRKYKNTTESDYYIKLIDQVLEEDDIDQDGYLNYPEYVRSRRKSSNNMKTQKEEDPVVEIVP
ncbi:hypothetical protein WA026_013874 [Henosepilachna vigintioctopunctata]|uniref:Uncharacterized protein n=1 Tax=Henosepilachna vigintioctopunctata TaxID=420089 RepID=A0AAW1U0S7_9CUCU